MSGRRGRGHAVGAWPRRHLRGAFLRPALGSILGAVGRGHAVPGRGRVQPELGSGGGRGDLHVGPDPEPRQVRTLRADAEPLLFGQTGLVPPGGSVLPAAAGAAAPGRQDGFGLGQLRYRQDAAALHLHAALLPQVRPLGAGTGTEPEVLGFCPCYSTTSSLCCSCVFRTKWLHLLCQHTRQQQLNLISDQRREAEQEVSTLLRCCAWNRDLVPDVVPGSVGL